MAPVARRRLSAAAARRGAGDDDARKTDARPPHGANRQRGVGRATGMNRWLRKGANWGPGAPRREYSDAHWDKPLRWNAKAAADGVQRRVFPSVCDPFDNEVDPQLRAQFFTLIAGTPHLTWLLLSKRIGNAKSMLPADWGDGYPNVWLGSTLCNREENSSRARSTSKLYPRPARLIVLATPFNASV